MKALAAIAIFFGPNRSMRYPELKAPTVKCDLRTSLSLAILSLTRNTKGHHGIPETLPEGRKVQALGRRVERAKPDEECWHGDRDTGQAAVNTGSHARDRQYSSVYLKSRHRIQIDSRCDQEGNSAEEHPPEAPDGPLSIRLLQRETSFQDLH